ncbi:MAG: AAA family ATPase [Bacillota bacterium]|nr:AAA family ATPase [Bacillota bacterium]
MECDGGFVGRTRELAALLTAVESCTEGRLVNVHGCAGVGKSYLLRRFAQELGRRGEAVVWLEGEELAAAAGSGGIGLARFLTGFRRRAREAKALVIDHYEPSPALDRLVRSRLLPAVRPGPLVVVASRPPLADVWDADSSLTIEAVRLDRFSPAEAREYLEAAGIKEAALLDLVISFAGGLPLALALTAGETRRALEKRCSARGSQPVTLDLDYRRIAQGLIRRLTGELADGELWAVVEAACVVRRSNEEILSHLLGRPVTAPTLNRLCDLSFVCLTPDGLAIQDEMRVAVLENLRWRAPARWEQLRRRAAAWLAGEEGTAERLFLVKDSLLRRYLFAESGERRLDWSGPPPAPEELVTVYRSWLRTYLGHGEDPSGELAQLLDLLRNYPEDFIALRDEAGRLSGFTCLIPVEPRSLPILRQSEITRRLVQSLANPYRPARVLLFPFVIAEAQDYEARAALVRASLERQLIRPRRAVFVAWVHDPMAARWAEQMLFTLVPGVACMVYGPESPVHYYALDLTRRRMKDWLDKVWASAAGTRSAAQPVVERSTVAEALRHFWEDAWLEGSPLARLNSVQARLGSSGGERNPRSLAEAVRAMLDEALTRLRRGEGCRSFRFGEEEERLLRLAYLERLGSHERVMERLGLARTTYYRRLRSALGHLVDVLASVDSPSQV